MFIIEKLKMEIIEEQRCGHIEKSDWFKFRIAETP
jgi:hypothetical protein